MITNSLAGIFLNIHVRSKCAYKLTYCKNVYPYGGIIHVLWQLQTLRVYRDDGHMKQGTILVSAPAHAVRYKQMSSQIRRPILTFHTS